MPFSRQISRIAYRNDDDDDGDDCAGHRALTVPHVWSRVGKSSRTQRTNDDGLSVERRQNDTCPQFKFNSFYCTVVVCALIGCLGVHVTSARRARRRDAFARNFRLLRGKLVL